MSGAERAAYDELFALADTDKDGKVSATEAAFLRKSGLANDVLGQVKKKKIEKKKKKKKKKKFVCFSCL